VRTTKRSSTFAALAVSLAFLAGACGGDDDGSTDTTTASGGSEPTEETTGGSTTEGSAPDTTGGSSGESGGSVTYAAEQEYTTYNNGTSDQGLFANTLVINMTLPGPWIVQPDLTVELDDALMVSAEVTSEDPQVVEYVVQENAVWSDGEPIDCDDFQLAYMSQNGKVVKPNPDYTGPGQTDAEGAEVAAELPVFNNASSTGYESIEKVECSDDGRTITATFAELYADWQALFGGLLPAHIVESNAGVDDLTTVDPVVLSPELEQIATFWNEGFVGFDPAIALSGAWYEISEFNAGQNLILKRNEKYYGTPGLLDEIVFLQVPDAEQQPTALANGDVQVISPQPNSDLVNQLKEITGITTTLSQGLTFEHYDFNQANVHLADINVRKAFSLCIDREEIVSTLIAPINPDATVLNNRMYVPQQPDYKDNSGGLKRDVAAAKALLEESGYVLGEDGVYAKDGNRLALRLGRRDPNPRRQSTNELVKEQCAEAGFELTDDPSEDMLSTRLPASDYDVILFAWVATPFPSSNTSIYSAPTDGGDQNYNNYVNPELKTKFDAANSELDPAARAEMMNEIDSIIWEDMATLPLFQFQELVANADTVSGVEFNGPQGVTWNANEWAVSA
jgi:peptide/nickel transport system substrate-binding protein